MYWINDDGCGSNIYCTGVSEKCSSLGKDQVLKTGKPLPREILAHHCLIHKLPLLSLNVYKSDLFQLLRQHYDKDAEKKLEHQIQQLISKLSTSYESGCASDVMDSGTE